MQLSGTQPQTPDDHIARAMALSGESIVMGGRILSELEESSKSFSAHQKGVELAKSAAGLKNVVAPIVEFVFSHTHGILEEITMALRVQEIATLNERTWQLALVCLEQQRRLVENTCGSLRKTIQRLKSKSRIVSAIWTPEWEDRYLDLLDEIDDVSETIALGLNPAMRAELERRESEI
jgi:hypothetical protein